MGEHKQPKLTLSDLVKYHRKKSHVALDAARRYEERGNAGKAKHNRYSADWHDAAAICLNRVAKGRDIAEEEVWVHEGAD